MQTAEPEMNENMLSTYRYPAEQSDKTVMEVFGACFVDYGGSVDIMPNGASTIYQRERLYQFAFSNMVTDA